MTTDEPAAKQHRGIPPPCESHIPVMPASASALYQGLQAEAHSAALRDGMPGLNDTSACGWSVLLRSALAAKRAPCSQVRARAMYASSPEASPHGNLSCFFLCLGCDYSPDARIVVVPLVDSNWRGCVMQRMMQLDLPLSIVLSMEQAEWTVGGRRVPDGCAACGLRDTTLRLRTEGLRGGAKDLDAQDLVADLCKDM